MFNVNSYALAFKVLSLRTLFIRQNNLKRSWHEDFNSSAKALPMEDKDGDTDCGGHPQVVPGVR